MSDPTEGYRRALVAALDATGVPEAYTGPVWDTAGLTEDFTVHSFMAPYVLVTRKHDGVKGTLMFTHSPRHYFRFEES